MPLPPRPFHSLNDIAIRWGVMPIDIVGWAVDGLLALSVAARPIKTQSSRVLCDLVEVAATDVFPLFRSDGGRLDKVSVLRARAQRETDWEWISEPAEGLEIIAPDVLVMRAEAQRLEREHGILGGIDSHGIQTQRRRAPGPGAPPRYDWDTFFVALVRRIFVQGLPPTQAELVREMLDWFQRRNDESAPDESTVRRKVAMVWRELNRAS